MKRSIPHIFLALLVCFCGLLLCTCTFVDDVAEVKLSNYSADINIGGTTYLTATVLPDNAYYEDIKWSSTNPAVASVQNGRIQGLSEGSAGIRATANGVSSKTCQINVKPIQVNLITLDYYERTLYVGSTCKLTHTIQPKDATNQNVVWTSNNPGVASVDNDGTVTARAKGTAQITVTSLDSRRLSATCRIQVIQSGNVAVSGIALNSSSLNLSPGQSSTLSYSIYPSNATNKSVTWSSSNTNVATVNASGTVTAKSAGNATITVKTVDGGYSSTCKVTVAGSNVRVTGISVSPTSISMAPSTTKTLSYSIYPSNASNKNVTWSSSNATVASVTSIGTVVAKKSGTATITVKTDDGGYTATCKVTVTSSGDGVAVTGISLNKRSLKMTVGETYQLVGTITPSNASNKIIIWSTRNKNVADVDDNGKVTATGNGSTTITAKTDDGGFTATCSISVEKIAVTGVSLNVTSITLRVGSSYTLTPIFTPSNASNKGVYWVSNRSKVATVDDNGKVTALSTGTATITVHTKEGNFTAQCTVKCQ